jgi:phosphatidylglycerol:prolipoprotein diacylglycerol transferase
LFRQPDPQLGFLFFVGGFGVTMGQLLSIPVLFAGIGVILWARREAVPAAIAAPPRQKSVGRA